MRHYSSTNHLNRVTIPQTVNLVDGNQTIPINAELLILRASTAIALNGNPVFFPGLEEGQILKIMNLSSFNITLNSGMSTGLILSENSLSLVFRQTASFIFIGGFWIQEFAINKFASEDKSNVILPTTETLDAWDLVNIYQLAGNVYCRKADASFGFERSIDGYVKNAVSPGENAEIYNKYGSAIAASTGNLIPNETYYLSVSGKFINNIVNRYDYLIQKAGRAIDKNTLAFFPEIIAVQKINDL